MSTKIEYLDITWNPATGCSKISEGCRGCWAFAMAERFKDSWGYDFKPKHHHNRIKTLLLKKPSRVGVCFMGDLFHEDLPTSVIEQVFLVISMAPQHTYFILTKRPERMEIFLRNQAGMPMENVWFGVSVEDQKTADERIPILLKIPGKRWVSVEPMLGPIDLWQYLPLLTIHGNHLEWVVIGAESGPKARKIDNSHILNLILQCNDTQVPVFLKQAWMGNKLVKMPKLGGHVWDQMPK